jgi:calcium-dependent phosphoinositide phospholipase C
VRNAVIACLAFVALGCSSEPTTPEQPLPSLEYPLDDTLRIGHLQVKSTHNSYHVEKEGNTLTALEYTHAPLTTQLEVQGVRHFELDLHRNPDDGSFEVWHLPVIDTETRCFHFVDCLAELRAWSDANRGHQPLVVQLELKDTFAGAGDPADAYLLAIDAAIRSVWPDRVLTPDDVQGGAATLGEAVAEKGWPTLGESRQKILFALDDEGEWRDALTHGGTSAAGRIIFPDSSPGDSYAAYAVLNDPVPDADAIGAALAANMIVRTRADSDTVEPRAGDTSRREAALASGAQFVSTDFPAPVEGFDYVMEIPGGTPSRCNPVTAPPECTNDAIESPERLK